MRLTVGSVTKSWKSLPGFGIASALMALLLLVAGCTEKQRPMNVLLVTLDTTRADFIGAYGRSDATTPTLDGLAEKGFLFERAHTSNPITQPAHATILTGVYPLMHGVRDNGLFHLPEDLDTLAELLGRQGFRTGAAIGGFPLTRDFGLDQGFEFYDDDLQATRRDQRGRFATRQFQTWYDERPAPHVNDAILGWLRADDDRPFFAWVHYWDPHEPHIAPPPYGQLYAHDPYQGEIAYADAALGSLIRQLESLGELERTLVIVTSDHGESRMEHGEMTHAFLAYESSMHVPLIVRVPGLDGNTRIEQGVGVVDIVPTVLELLNMSIPDLVQGRSLAGFMIECDSCPEPVPGEYYAESLSPRLSHNVGELRVLYDGNRKYIHGPRPEMFDLDADPAELENLLNSEPGLAAQAQEDLSGVMEWFSGDLSASHEFDASVVERLAALGYINMSGGEIETNEELLDGGVAPQDVVGDINRVFQLRRQIDAGRYALAVHLAEDLLDRQPDNEYVRGRLAFALANLGRIEDAIALLADPPRVDSTSIDAFMRVASMLNEAGESDRAIEIADDLLASARSSTALTIAADINLEQGRLQGAQRRVEEALELNPEDRGARFLALEVALESETPKTAMEHANVLIEQLPHEAMSQFALARALWAQNDREAALRRAEIALMLNPYLCDAAVVVPGWLNSLGRADQARAAQSSIPSNCRDSGSEL